MMPRKLMKITAIKIISLTWYCVIMYTIYQDEKKLAPKSVSSVRLPKYSVAQWRIYRTLPSIYNGEFLQKLLTSHFYTPWKWQKIFLKLKKEGIQKWPLCKCLTTLFVSFLFTLSNPPFPFNLPICLYWKPPSLYQ